MQCVSELNVIVACSGCRMFAPAALSFTLRSITRASFGSSNDRKRARLMPNSVCVVYSHQRLRTYEDSCALLQTRQASTQGCHSELVSFSFVSFQRGHTLTHIHGSVRAISSAYLHHFNRIHFVFRNYSDYQIYKTNTFSERFG